MTFVTHLGEADWLSLPSGILSDLPLCILFIFPTTKIGDF